MNHDGIRRSAAARSARVALCAMLLAAGSMITGLAAATGYVPTTTADFAFTAVDPATGAITAGTGIGQVTLRSAIVAADSNGPGPHSVTLSSATYDLTEGEITFGSSAQNIDIGGAGSALTTINMVANANQDRIFFINNTGLTPGVQTSIHGIKFSNGHLNTDPYGGGAIIAGGPANSLTITDCVFDSNTLDAVNGGTTGAAVNMAGGGALSIDHSTFINNTNPVSDGGAVYYFFDNFPGLTGSVTITDSNFIGNKATADGSRGGAIGVAAQGRIDPFDQTLTVSILRNNFAANSADDAGGAIVVNNGDPAYTFTISDNRIAGNSAGQAGASGVAVITASGTASAPDNWWGCNAGPNVAGACDKIAVVAGAAIPQATWLQLRNVVSPGALLPGAAAGVTADILGRNAGGPLPAAALVGLPAFPATPTAIFSNAVKGMISAASTQFVNGIATATFTADNTPASCGAGSVDATADSQTITAAVTIQCPDLTATKTNNVSNVVVVGQAWTWTITVTNSGGVAATFPPASAVIVDNLPPGVAYGTPVVSGIAGVTCAIDGSDNLTCTANTSASIGSGGGSFTVAVPAVAVASGTAANPRGGGFAQVDPDNVVVESDDGNNGFANAVSMLAAGTTLMGASDAPDPTVAGQAYTVGVTVAVNAPGAGTPTGNVIVADGAGGTCTIVLPASSCQLTSVAVGPLTLSYSYAGDGNFLGSSTTGSHQVSAADTTIAITADAPDPSVVGQSVTVSYSVSVVAPGSGSPPGNVVVTVSGGAETCSGTVAAGSCSVALLSAGNRTITATYPGTGSFNASVSTGEPHVVNKASTTTAITADAPDPSAVGQSVTVAYTVAAIAPGSGTPTGNVTVSDGVSSCTGTVGAGSCTLSLATAGARTLTATYTGDANFSGGVSANEPHAVVAAPVLGKVFSPATVATNGTTTLAFTIINPAVNTVALTGVTFTDAFPNSPNLVVATPLTVTNNCGGTLQDAGGGSLAAGDTGIQLTGGTVGANASCTISVNVTPLATGPFNNVSGAVSSTNGGSGNTASATLGTNGPPVIVPSAVAANQGDAAANRTIASISDPDQAANTLTLTINGGASATSNGVTVSTLAISGVGVVTANVATTCAATDASFTLVATDSTSLTDTKTLNVSVGANAPPTLSYASPQSVAAGSTLAVNPATGPSDNGSVASIVLQSITPALSSAAMVNNATGVVQFTNATPAGTYSVVVRAADNCSVTRDATFTLNVTCGGITLPALSGGAAGAAYNQSAAAAPAAAYTYTVSTGALPPGLSLNPTTGAVTGTPTTAGTFSFSITATNVHGCVGTQAYSITIGQGTQTITFPPIADAHVGTSAQLGATSSSGLAVTYVSLTPATCSVSGNIVQWLSPGVCTIRASQAGDASFTAAADVDRSFLVGEPVAVPALSPWMLASLGVLLLVAGGAGLRRRTGRV